jgi:hypothetical protein
MNTEMRNEKGCGAVCEYYGTLSYNRHLASYCFKPLRVHRPLEPYFGDVLLHITVYIMEVQRCGILFW